MDHGSAMKDVKTQILVFRRQGHRLDCSKEVMNLFRGKLESCYSIVALQWHILSSRYSSISFARCCLPRLPFMKTPISYGSLIHYYPCRFSWKKPYFQCFVHIVRTSLVCQCTETYHNRIQDYEGLSYNCVWFTSKTQRWCQCTTSLWGS